MIHVRNKQCIIAILLAYTLILSGCNPRVQDTPPAADLFFQLHKKNIRVGQLGRHVVFPELYERWRDPKPLCIPSELRFKPLDAKSLLEITAKRNDLDFVWLNDGSVVVLYKKGQDREVQLALTGLSAVDLTVRAQAVALASAVEDPRVVPVLVAAANANDPDVAREATASLRRLGWPAVLMIAPEAINLTARDLESPDNTVRQEALYALGQAGGDKAFALIEKILENKAENGVTDFDKESLRGNAIIALAMADKDRALPVVEKALDATGYLQFYAIAALGQIGGEKSIALIEKELQRMGGSEHPSNTYMLLQNAIFSLQQIGSDRALAIIQNCLASGDINSRWTALTALSQSGALNKDGILTNDGREMVCALVELSLYPNSPWLEPGVEVLWRMRDERSMEILSRALRDKNIREHVAAALARIESDDASPIFEPLLASEDVGIRRNAVAAMGYFGPKRALRYLSKALDDDDAQVRLNALKALQASPGSHIDATVLPLLRKALTDKDPHVRWSALNELSSHGALTGDNAEKSAAIIELTVLHEALKDANAGTRVTAVTILQQLNGEKSAPLLDTALNDESTDVRKAAVTSLEYLAGIGEQRAVALLGKALQNNDPGIRELAVSAICKSRRNFVQPTVLELLKKAMTDNDAAVRKCVVSALGYIGGVRARDALIRQLTVEQDRNVLLAIRDELRLSWAIDGVAEKALREFKMPPSTQ